MGHGFHRKLLNNNCLVASTNPWEKYDESRDFLNFPIKYGKVYRKFHGSLNHQAVTIGIIGMLEGMIV